jgi:hypothetical protein
MTHGKTKNKNPLRYLICIHLYILISNTISYLVMFIWLVTRWVSLVEQDLLTLPELLSSPRVFMVRVAQSLVFCMVFYRSLLVRFSFSHCVVCLSIYGFSLFLQCLECFPGSKCALSVIIQNVYESLLCNFNIKYAIK